MMHTEDEAKKLWCPHSIAMHAGGHCGNRDAENNTMEWPNCHPSTAKQTSCIASKCMSWRWVTELKTFDLDPDLSAEVRSDRGYCGLAGKP